MTESRRRFALAAVAIALCVADAGGDAVAAERLVELRAGERVHRGRVVAKGSDYILLEDRAGRFDWVETPAVTAFRKTSAFRPYSGVEFKDRLLREFGRDREVSASRHFVVVGPPGRTREYVRVLDAVYGSFTRFFRVRGVRLEEPGRSLPMIVFPDRRGFDAYARRDTGSTGPTLSGYYYPPTNRVALFEQRGRDGKIDADRTRDTLIHEAVHQLGFNTGLHNRLGINPKWVVEGIAMIFESPGVRTRQPSARPSSRVNIERLYKFKADRGSRPEGYHLALVGDDRPFEADALRAYAEAWALNFYLLEKRSVAYARYIQKVSGRTEPSYPAGERVADFLAAFGKNTARFAADYLKFIDGLEPR